MSKESGVAAKEQSVDISKSVTVTVDEQFTHVHFAFDEEAKLRLMRLRQWEARSENVALELTGRG